MSTTDGMTGLRPSFGREAARAGRFAVVGVAATFVHGAIYLSLVSADLASPRLANVAGFVVAFLVSLAGQYGWTFADRTGGSPGRDGGGRRFVSPASRSWASR